MRKGFFADIITGESLKTLPRKGIFKLTNLTNAKSLRLLMTLSILAIQTNKMNTASLKTSIGFITYIFVIMLCQLT